MPFILLLAQGRLFGDAYKGMEKGEKTLVVWEWFIYPIGTTVYFCTFFIFWVLRRMRRRYYELDSKRYHAECFEANRSFLEFILDRKFAKTKEIEAGLENKQYSQLRRCHGSGEDQ